MRPNDAVLPMACAVGVRSTAPGELAHAAIDGMR